MDPVQYDIRCIVGVYVALVSGMELCLGNRENGSARGIGGVKLVVGHANVRRTCRTLCGEQNVGGSLARDVIRAANTVHSHIAGCSVAVEVGEGVVKALTGSRVDVGDGSRDRLEEGVNVTGVLCREGRGERGHVRGRKFRR